MRDLTDHEIYSVNGTGLWAWISDRWQSVSSILWPPGPREEQASDQNPMEGGGHVYVRFSSMTLDDGTVVSGGSNWITDTPNSPPIGP